MLQNQSTEFDSGVLDSKMELRFYAEIVNLRVRFWLELVILGMGSPHIGKVGRRTVHHEARFQSVEEDW